MIGINFIFVFRNSDILCEIELSCFQVNKIVCVLVNETHIN